MLPRDLRILVVGIALLFFGCTTEYSRPARSAQEAAGLVVSQGASESQDEDFVERETRKQVLPRGEHREKEGKPVSAIPGDSAREGSVIREESPMVKEHREFRQAYNSAEDKLGFLLEHMNATDYSTLKFIAKRLGNFDNAKSRSALQRLTKVSLGWDTTPVSYYAERSLEKLDAKDDLQQLKPHLAVNAQRGVIEKYAFSDNAYARGYIGNYLSKQAQEEPERYVPLLVEYYAYYPYTRNIAQFPEYADNGLERCLNGTNATPVARCIDLVRDLRREQFYQRIFDVSFGEKGNIDYKDTAALNHLRSRTLSAFDRLGAEAFSYLEQVLYVGEYKEVRDAISVFTSYGTEDAYEILVNFKKHLEGDPLANPDIQQALVRSIAKIEGAER